MSSAAMGIQRILVELPQVGTLGEVLAEQAVGVLVAAALPGAAWVAEIDLDTGVDGELQVFGHLLAVIPGEGAAQLLRQSEDGGGQCRPHALGGEPVREWEQEHIAAVALHQGSHCARPPAEHQVAFPVARAPPGRPPPAVAG